MNGNDLERVVNKTEEVADRTEKSAGWNNIVVKILLLISVALLIVTSGLAYLVQRNNENNEETQRILRTAQGEIHQLVEFTEDLQAPDSPEEQARNDAITSAVQLVPVILQVLCEQFQDSPSCQGG